LEQLKKLGGLDADGFCEIGGRVVLDPIAILCDLSELQFKDLNFSEWH
jgi:hypothetical protein